MSGFSRDVLRFDAAEKASALAQRLRQVVIERLRRRGVVVAVSGGIDSACVAALAARAFGNQRVFGLILPERDSSPESEKLAVNLCARLGIRHVVQDIAPILEAAGCYRLRDEAVRSVFPAFEPGMRWKLVSRADRFTRDGFSLFKVVVRDHAGKDHLVRLTTEAYLQIVAATSFKQRTRKMLEYYQADRLVYAVAGTPNRLEYDQGFFVKLGDGAADVKPIAGLYKTQVFALSAYLGVTDAILAREPTTDTFSLEQSQEDFFFSLNYRELDLILWGKNHDISPAEVAAALDLAPAQVERVYEDIEQKRRATAYLHAPAVLLEPVREVQMDPVVEPAPRLLG